MRIRLEFRQHTDIVRCGWFGEPEPVTTYEVSAVTRRREWDGCDALDIWDSGPCASKEDALQKLRKANIGCAVLAEAGENDREPEGRIYGLPLEQPASVYTSV